MKLELVEIKISGIYAADERERTLANCENGSSMSSDYRRRMAQRRHVGGTRTQLSKSLARSWGAAGLGQEADLNGSAVWSG